MITFLNILLILILLFVCFVLGLFLFGLFYSFAFLQKVRLIFSKTAVNASEKINQVHSSIKSNSTGLEESNKYIAVKEKYDIENKLLKTSENLDKTIKETNKLFGNVFGVLKYLIALIIVILILGLISLIYVILKSF